MGGVDIQSLDFFLLQTYASHELPLATYPVQDKTGILVTQNGELEIDSRVYPFRFFILFLLIVVLFTLFGEWIFVVEGRDEEVGPKLGLVLRYLFRLPDATRLV